MSPITPFVFKGQFYHIKRDDLLRPFEGNKARKFHYFLTNNFPNITTVVSHGSNQSNAMYSLSVLSKMFNINSRYYVKYLSQKLKTNPTGNLKKSIKNKLKIIENEEIIKKILSLYEDYKLYRQQEKILKKILAIDEERLKIAKEKYLQGVGDYISIRDSWNNLIATKKKLLLVEVMKNKILLDIMLTSGEEIR